MKFEFYLFPDKSFREREMKLYEQEEAMSSNNTYLLKLKKSFQLIMNDLPDNRDDTINAKLLDSIKTELKTNRALTEYLKTFILEELITSDQFKLNIIDKDPEVIQFFLDLITAYISETQSTDLITPTVDFIQLYFESNFNTQFLTESIIGCSFLNLIITLFQMIDAANSTRFNDNILDFWLFSQQSLSDHLSIDCKSIFVRKTFKQLLNLHLVSLIDKSSRVRFSSLLNSLNAMNFETKLHNLDIYSDLIQYYLFTTNQQLEAADILNFIKQIHQVFIADKQNYLTNLNLFVNDASIESFTFIFVFDLLLTNSDLVKIVDKCCIDLIRQALQYECKQSLFKKSIDHLFKFLIYFYSFVSQFEQSVQINNLTTSLNVNTNVFSVVKSTIKKQLVMSLNLNSADLDEHGCLHSIASNSLINNFLTIDKFNTRLLVLKQCIINLKLFVRKFKTDNLNLFQFITTKQIIYVLRHLNIEYDTKNKLIDFLIDYFMSNDSACECFNAINSESLSQLIDCFLGLFQLKLDESFNDNVFKLLSIQINIIDIDNLNKAINSHLVSQQKSDSLIEHLMKIANFLIILLKKNFQNLQFVSQILNANGLLVKYCDFILSSDSSLNSDLLAEFKDSTLQLLTLIFEALTNSKQSHDFEPINDQFINAIELNCLEETEAFLRREYVLFLSSFKLNQFETVLNRLQTSQLDNFDTKFLNSANYFSNLLITDFDWQIQLYCLGYFESISKHVNENSDLSIAISAHQNMVTDSNLANFNIFEIVFCLSDFFKSIFKTLDDCDQHVVNKTASLILNLKQSVRIINLVRNYLTKTNAGRLEQSIDKFMNDVNLVEKLHSVLKTSMLTSDIYTLNPASILDDIISSYQFEADDEKFIDCY